MKKKYLSLLGLVITCLLVPAQNSRILGDPVDMSVDFANFRNTFFFADKVVTFNPNTAKGTISWKRATLYTRQAFDVNTILPQDLKMLDFPGAAYEQNPQLRFSIDFVSPRTVRIRMLTCLLYTSPSPRD